MEERRNLIIEGKNPIPFEKLKSNPEFELIEQFCNSLWSNYVKNPKYHLSIPYWSDKFTHEINFRIAMIALAKSGWIKSTCSYVASWGQVQLNEDKLLNYCTPDELSEMRAKYKYSKYSLVFGDSTISNKTKICGELVNTGLKRKGFAKAGNTQFGFDTFQLRKYKKAVCKNFTKGMFKVREKFPEMGTDEASYDVISEGIAEFYIDNPEELYTTGNNLSDSRGRAISSCLSKVGNPIGYKDMRALLVVTY